MPQGVVPSDSVGRHLAALAAATTKSELEAAYIAAHEYSVRAGIPDALMQFKTLYAKRCEELAAAPPAALRAGMETMVRRGLAIVQGRLDAADEDSVPDQLALRAIEVGARALGMGQRTEEKPTVVINMGEHLESLAQNLVQLLRKKRGETIDG
jgi:hypothetical protein